jgi:hypothetical protein
MPYPYKEVRTLCEQYLLCEKVITLEFLSLQDLKQFKSTYNTLKFNHKLAVKEQSRKLGFELPSPYEDLLLYSKIIKAEPLTVEIWLDKKREETKNYGFKILGVSG